MVGLARPLPVAWQRQEQAAVGGGGRRGRKLCAQMPGYSTAEQQKLPAWRDYLQPAGTEAAGARPAGLAWPGPTRPPAPTC